MDVNEERVDERSSFETLETWDSAREVELALMLEFEYGVALNDEELSNLHSVSDLRSLLAARGISEP